MRIPVPLQPRVLTDPEARKLYVPEGIVQKMDWWCWAACAEMIFVHFAEPGNTQCRVVEKYCQDNHIPHPPCCTEPTPPAKPGTDCNQGLNRDQFGSFYSVWKYSTAEYAGEITDAEHKDQIVQYGHPWQAIFHDGQHVGHTVVVNGWDYDHDYNWDIVGYIDPAAGVYNTMPRRFFLSTGANSGAPMYKYLVQFRRNP